VKIERLILGKACRVRARLTFFLFDLYSSLKPYHIKVKEFNTICGAFFNHRFKASIFSRNSGSCLSTGCENSLFEENFLPKGCFQNKRGRKKKRVKRIGFQPFFRKEVTALLRG